MTMHLFDSASNDPVGEEALGSSYCASPMAQPSPTHSWQGSSDGPIAGAAARPPLGCAPGLAGFSDNVHSYEPDLDTCRSRQRTVRQRSARDAGWPSLHLRQSQLPRRAARHRLGRLCHPPCLLPHRGARAGRRLPAPAASASRLPTQAGRRSKEAYWAPSRFMREDVAKLDEQFFHALWDDNNCWHIALPHRAW